MSVEERVVEVLTDWAGQAPPDFTVSLDDLWILGRSEPFDPDGIEQLIQKLEGEFDELEVTAGPDDFRGAGKIKTVQKLIDEIDAFPPKASDAPARKAKPKTKAKKASKPKGRKK